MVLILLACIGHHAPEMAEAGATLRLVSVVDSVANADVAAGPAALDLALAKQLSLRGIAVGPFDTSTALKSFSDHRDTRARLNSLPDPQSPTLLVETVPSYYSEMNGKYRWTVHVVVSISPSEYSKDFDVPVFLQFYHEREDAAVASATPVIAQHTAQLLDAWLAAP